VQISNTNFREPVSPQTYKKVQKCIVNTKEVAVFDNHAQDVTSEALHSHLSSLLINSYQIQPGLTAKISFTYPVVRQVQVMPLIYFIHMADLLTPRYSHFMIHHNDDSGLNYQTLTMKKSRTLCYMFIITNCIPSLAIRWKLC
jgi:hypothetical protein